MVDLTNPDPDPPKEGREFRITASAGSPPYQFSWQVNEGAHKLVVQEERTLKINIPDETAGESLSINLEDNNGDKDSDDFRIT